MSNGDDEADPDAADEDVDAATDEAADAAEDEAEAADDGAEAGAEDVPATDDRLREPEDFEAALDDVAEDLEAADTEGDLDDVEARLDDIAADLEAADLPEPDEDDEDEGEEAEDPAAAIEDRISDLRDDLEAARGPYVEDVTAILSEAETTIEEGEWTEDGEPAVVEAVDQFAASVNDVLDVDVGSPGDTPGEAVWPVAEAREAIEDADLDPDDDAEAIEALLDAAETLESDLEDAEVWSDLTIREQLAAEGFYDVLNPENRKDFPPEWNAIKIYADRGEPEPILTALERYESDFMEENALDALERFAPEEAVDPLHERAQKRAKHPIRILGRIGDDSVCETLHDFLGGGDVALEKVTLRALGMIGSADSTQAVANRLDADNPEIASVAARSLGLIGDTRAIDPLADVLADHDADEVRASAAWALNQIGTEDALDAAAEFADDRSYIVQAEAEKAAGA